MRPLTITSSRLRALRDAKGMSQDEVAKYLGITRTAYNKYEAGVIYPVRNVKELATLFHVTTDYILGYPESPLEVQVRQADAHTRKQVGKYLALSKRGQDIVDVTLDAVYQREGCPNHSSEEIGSS